MIDFRVKTFIDLCETRNYTKTAKRLCITQPAVTQHIKHLESKYNIKLFEYMGKTLNLTKTGQEFLKNILKLKTLSLSIENNLKNSVSSNKPMSFGATRTIGEFVIPDIIKNYITLYPDSNLTVIVENTSLLLDMLNKGIIEFCFIEGHFNRAEYETHTISKEDFVVIASPDNEIVKNKNFKIEDLFSQNLIIRESGSGSRDIFEMWLYEKNFSYKNFKSILEIGNINLIKNLVKENFGISIMYKAAVLEEIENNELTIIDIKNMNLSHEFNFIFLKNSIFSEDYISFYKEIMNF